MLFSYYKSKNKKNMRVSIQDQSNLNFLIELKEILEFYSLSFFSFNGDYNSD